MEKQTPENVDSDTQTEPTSKTCIYFHNKEIKPLQTDIQKVVHLAFILTALGMGLTLCPLSAVDSLIIDIHKWKGYTFEEALLAFPVSCGVGLIARIIPGMAKQFTGVNSFVCQIIFGVSGASAQLVLLLSSCNITLLIGCGFMGGAIAGLSSGVNIIVAKIVDQEQIPVGIGLIYSTLGILATGQPMVGVTVLIFQ